MDEFKKKFKKINKLKIHETIGFSMALEKMMVYTVEQVDMKSSGGKTSQMKEKSSV